MGEEHATASHILLQATVLNHPNTLDFNDVNKISGRRFNHMDYIKKHRGFNEALIEKEHRHIESFKFN